jgi:IrrE N-terminal-like domain
MVWTSSRVRELIGGLPPSFLLNFPIRAAGLRCTSSSSIAWLYMPCIGARRETIVKKNIEWYSIDAGDQRAGSIRVARRAGTEKEATLYGMQINQNHAPAVQFTTLAHELGHLCLGHLGPDKKLNVPERTRLDCAQQELEAESVAYLVCERNGVHSKSETYLSEYVRPNTTIEHIDLYHVMRAAGQVETLLGLTAHMKLGQTTTRGSLNRFFNASFALIRKMTIGELHHLACLRLSTPACRQVPADVTPGVVQSWRLCGDTSLEHLVFISILIALRPDI